MNKHDIIEAIRRSAEENGGVALGIIRFEAMTGISPHMWRGKFWRNWSEAVEEAGLAPNRMVEGHDRTALVVSLLELARRLRRFPTYADLQMERRSNDAFASPKVFNKLGDLGARIEVLRAYATEHREYWDVLEVLPASDHVPVMNGTDDTDDRSDGSVYMVKLGRHYKVGKTFSVPRRHREIALELPEKPDLVHVITTDDPTGIEAYWHARFGERRTNGEWFALTREDVRAFKRRRFM
jgi:hypothetical protein